MKRALSPRWCPGDDILAPPKPADPSRYRKICYSDLSGACLVIHRDSVATSSVYLPSSVMDLEVQYRDRLVGTGMTMRLLTPELERFFPKAAEHRNAAQDAEEVDSAFNDLLISGIGCYPPLNKCIDAVLLAVDTWGISWLVMGRSCPIAALLCRDTMQKFDKWAKLRKELKEKEKELEEQVKKEKEAEPAGGAGSSGGDPALSLDPGSGGLSVPPGVLLTDGHWSGGGGKVVMWDCPCHQM